MADSNSNHNVNSNNSTKKESEVKNGANNNKSASKNAAGGAARATVAPTTTVAPRQETLTDADDWLDDDATGLQAPIAAAVAKDTTTEGRPPSESDTGSLASVADPLESSGREDEWHRQRYKANRPRHRQHHHHCHQKHEQAQNCKQNHHHHHHHHNQAAIKGHIKELIKPDPTVRHQRARIIRTSGGMSATSSSNASPVRSPPLVGTDSSRVIRSSGRSNSNDPNAHSTLSAAFRTPPSARVAVVVDEEQLQERLRESISEKAKIRQQQQTNRPVATTTQTAAAAKQAVLGTTSGRERRKAERRGKAAAAAPADPGGQQKAPSSAREPSSSRSSSSSSTSSHSHSSSSHDADDEIDGRRSPPPAAIIIPPSVAKSLSSRASARRDSGPPSSSSSSSGPAGQSGAIGATNPADPSPSAITREQLEYGPLLKPGEVQILYRSPETDSTSLDRHLKEEQAKLVAPNMRQSPIAIMTMNPTYELQNKPLIIEYPARVENLKLNNTGFMWEVKIPYQISMTTALSGAHLNQSHRYRLDQFHCHWGSDDQQGSEHTVDNRHYSAELHFVHYNMEKYRTMSKAARHPDGLVVLGVFLEASDEHHNHAELEKIVSHLKHVPLKGEHSIIRQAVHIENLLPQNRSYWSYQGSLTTPPHFESVTWFIFKHPIRCNRSQIQRFRKLRSTLRADEDADSAHRIDTNHRKTQPLNGRSIVNYDDQPTGSSSGNSNNHLNRGNSSHLSRSNH